MIREFRFDLGRAAVQDFPRADLVSLGDAGIRNLEEFLKKTGDLLGGSSFGPDYVEENTVFLSDKVWWLQAEARTGRAGCSAPRS